MKIHIRKTQVRRYELKSRGTFMYTRILIVIVIFLVTGIEGLTQTNELWTIPNKNNLDSLGRTKPLIENFLMLSLDLDLLRNRLTNSQDQKSSSQDSLIISVPDPEGVLRIFKIAPTNVIAPEVRDRYSIRTFSGHMVNDPAILISCDLTERGFKAVIHEGSRTYFIEPFANSPSAGGLHICYFKRDLPSTGFGCGYESTRTQKSSETQHKRETSTSTDLKTYRIAFVASGEYGQQFGPSKTDVLNSFASGLNMINTIYKRDLGIVFILVSTEALVWLDPSTDPFDLTNQNALIAQNHSECTNILGTNAFDVGHLLVWSNTGGLASPGVCDGSLKGYGFSGSNTSILSLYIDYAAHEIGHQLNAEHNFVSLECSTSVENFRFEPGEGSSIMSYAGVCGSPASYQSNSNQYFHAASINSILNFVSTSATCAATSMPGAGNSSAPIVNAGLNVTIPKRNAFYTGR